MKNRKPQKPDPQSVSTEAGLAATTRYPSGRPVGGETFLLTSPFIERRWRSAASRAGDADTFNNESSARLDGCSVVRPPLRRATESRRTILRMYQSVRPARVHSG